MSFPLETIVSRAKRKGFVYPNSDIYGGLANAWDYGPYGSMLKKNISDLWIRYFVQDRSDMVLMDTAIIANPQTWVASGHAGNFGDALIDDKITRQRFRADKLIEDWITGALHDYSKFQEEFKEHYINVAEKIGHEVQEKINKLKNKNNQLKVTIEDNIRILEGYKEALDEKYSDNKAIKSLINDFRKDRTSIITSINAVRTELEDEDEISGDIEYLKKLLHAVKLLKAGEFTELLKYILDVDNLIPESRGNEKMTQVIKDKIPNNPDTKKPADWTDARQFNLMLQTQLGVIEDVSAKAYLRPETCQSLFTNFKNLCDTTRVRIPFGMAQVGKAFRNEITPGQFLYRTREFEQMEIEYFVENNLETANKAFEMRKELSMKFWQEQVQLKAENLRFRQHEADELSFYSAGTFDVEYNYPRGWGELQGIANRTDYDLKQHQKTSGKDLQYNDPKTGARYIPYVIEPSFGLSRTVMAVFMDCYDEEVTTKEDGSTDTRIVVRFPFQLAPVKYAILPLLEKNEEMVSLGQTIYNSLKSKFKCELDISGGIGKRYRRQDEIGTPYCICIDHTSLEDGTVTIRHRDTMKQTRVKWEEIGN